MLQQNILISEAIFMTVLKGMTLYDIDSCLEKAVAQIIENMQE